jgi:hypothetical protein
MRRPRTTRLVALLGALLVAGCGVGAESSPRAVDGRSRPRLVVPPSTAPTGAAHALVYFVQDGQLVAVSRRVPAPPTPDGVLRALLAGPDLHESDAGLTSAAPAGISYLGRTGSIVQVQVPHTDPADAARTDEVLGYAQLVASLTALRTVTGVEFVRDGRPLAVPRGDGSLSAQPLTRKDYASLL